MFIKLNSGTLLNLFWVMDCNMDKHDPKRMIVYLVNGTNLVETYNSETEAQEEFHIIKQEMANALPDTRPIIVDELPTEDIAIGRVYIVPTKYSEGEDLYEEFYYNETKGEWESLGVQKGNLKEYYKKTEIDAMLSWKIYK